MSRKRERRRASVGKAVGHGRMVWGRRLYWPLVVRVQAPAELEQPDVMLVVRSMSELEELENMVEGSGFGFSWSEGG